MERPKRLSLSAKSPLVIVIKRQMEIGPSIGARRRSMLRPQDAVQIILPRQGRAPPRHNPYHEDAIPFSSLMNGKSPVYRARARYENGASRRIYLPAHRGFGSGSTTSLLGGPRWSSGAISFPCIVVNAAPIDRGWAMVSKIHRCQPRQCGPRPSQRSSGSIS